MDAMCLRPPPFIFPLTGGVPLKNEKKKKNELQIGTRARLHVLFLIKAGDEPLHHPSGCL